MELRRRRKKWEADGDGLFHRGFATRVLRSHSPWRRVAAEVSGADEAGSRLDG